MTIEPEALTLPPSGAMPNNPWLPALIYRAALPPGTPDKAAAFEDLFGRNGWPAQWRNGIFAYHHYHAEAHEVLGIARGGTAVLLGGPDGPLVQVSAGDVLVLPAGTGHRNMTPEADLLTVGAYPPGAVCDVRRDALPAEAMARMRHVPFPDSDPVLGHGGALTRLWMHR
ncbi:MAG: cupin [Caulobacteraceae bacterium]|nr:cupin [Caulobacter sp.]